MNKIQELLKNKFNIKEIKKVKLKDVADFSNGKGHEKVVEKDGKYILITSKAISTDMEQIRRTNLMLSPLFKDDITMVMSDLPNGKALAKCFIVDEDNKYTLNQRICSIKVKNKEIILPKFLYYYLNRNSQLLKYDDGTNQTNLKKDDIINIKIAVPPMEVQREIVRILDKFTLYSAELSAELILRKKQYEYYMDYLFYKRKGLNKVKLSDVLLSLKTGLNPRKFFELNTPDAKGHYVTVRELGNRMVKYWESKDKVNEFGLNRINERSNLEVNDVLFSGTGTIGRVSLIEEKPKNWNVKEGIYILKPNIGIINPLYLMFAMRSNYIRDIYSEYTVGSPVASVPMRDLKNIEFNLPHLEEQKRIANILDKFDKLCHDMFEGLPAEIEARQKQYEYYRDKLLSFD